MPYPRREFTFKKVTPELAYLLGVYLGDGSIGCENGEPRFFQISSIDKDFLVHVKNICETIFGSLPEIKYYAYDGYTSKGIDYPKYSYYRFSFRCIEFCKWLVSITDNKLKIPCDVERTTPTLKRFLEGFLDSEGWVAKAKKTNTLGYHRYTVGFANSSLWTDEIAKLLQKVHVKPTGRRLGYSRVGTPFIQYTLNVRSFIHSGLRFHIKRKQDRLEMYKKQYMTPSETIRLPSEDIVQSKKLSDPNMVAVNK